MGSVRVGGIDLHYRDEGRRDAPALVFSHSLGASCDMWWPQVESLADRFRIVRFDTRGHGLSSCPDGEYRLAELGADALGLMDALGLASASFCGLSLGGQVGMWLALHAAERIERLVLANTAARLGTRQGWQERIDLVRSLGVDAVAEGALARWFTDGFRATGHAVRRALATLLATSPQGYAGCCAVLRDADLRGEIGRVRARTLVIGASSDAVTTPATTRELAGSIPGAAYVELDAAHLANVEQPEAFSRELAGFLTERG